MSTVFITGANRGLGLNFVAAMAKLAGEFWLHTEPRRQPMN